MNTTQTTTTTPDEDAMFAWQTRQGMSTPFRQTFDTVCARQADRLVQGGMDFEEAVMRVMEAAGSLFREAAEAAAA